MIFRQRLRSTRGATYRRIGGMPPNQARQASARCPWSKFRQDLASWELVEVCAALPALCPFGDSKSRRPPQTATVHEHPLHTRVRFSSRTHTATAGLPQAAPVAILSISQVAEQATSANSGPAGALSGSALMMVGSPWLRLLRYLRSAFCRLGCAMLAVSLPRLSRRHPCRRIIFPTRSVHAVSRQSSNRGAQITSPPHPTRHLPPADSGPFAFSIGASAGRKPISIFCISSSV